MRTLFAVLLLLFAARLMAAQSSVPLNLPPPMSLPEFTDTTKVSKALLTALANRKWLVEADTGEFITARLNIRAHSALIRLDYTPRQIKFHFLESTNLGQEIENGEILIHPNFNKWLLQLQSEIQIQVQRFSFEREPMAVVPPAPPAAESPSAPATSVPMAPAPPPAPQPAAQ